MKKIWKWTLLPECDLDMPNDAVILAVQEQHGKARLWALVDIDAKTEQRHFSTYGTGHVMPDNPGMYVGTFQMDNGWLVFHVFENTK